MTPYYDRAGITIYHARAEDVLPVLSAPVAAVLTDPPYGTTDGLAKLNGARGGGWESFGHEWDRELPLWWIAEAERLLLPGGAMAVWTDKLSVQSVWLEAARVGLHPLHTLYWRKTNPPTNPRKNFCSAVESAVFARKPGAVLRWAGGGATHNVFEAPLVGGSVRIHPTQKPLRLMAWLVRLLVPAGGLVLDPFMGSGTTLRAAKNFGCCAVGVEQDEMYCEAAARRMEQDILPMFGGDDEEAA